MLTEEMSRANRRLHRAPALDAHVRALLQSVDRGEWTTVARFPAARARYARYAKATLRRRRTE
jgi:hypothetical protein